MQHCLGGRPCSLMRPQETTWDILIEKRGENSSNIIPRIYLDPSINDPQLGLASPKHKAWSKSVTFHILDVVTIHMRLSGVVNASSVKSAAKIKLRQSSQRFSIGHFLTSGKAPMNADDVFRLEPYVSCKLCTFS